MMTRDTRHAQTLRCGRWAGAWQDANSAAESVADDVAHHFVAVDGALVVGAPASWKNKHTTRA
jgi:hypothetical protein